MALRKLHLIINKQCDQVLYEWGKENIQKLRPISLVKPKRTLNSFNPKWSVSTQIFRLGPFKSSSSIASTNSEGRMNYWKFRNCQTTDLIKKKNRVCIYFHVDNKRFNNKKSIALLELKQRCNEGTFGHKHYRRTLMVKNKILRMEFSQNTCNNLVLQPNSKN